MKQTPQTLKPGGSVGCKPPRSPVRLDASGLQGGSHPLGLQAGLSKRAEGGSRSTCTHAGGLWQGWPAKLENFHREDKRPRRPFPRGSRAPRSVQSAALSKGAGRGAGGPARSLVTLGAVVTENKSRRWPVRVSPGSAPPWVLFLVRLFQKSPDTARKEG